MTSFFGHDEQTALFAEAMASARMHHAWLFAGPRGIGKARFAEAAARRMLADAAGPPVTGAGLDVPEDHRIAHYFAAGSHPDYRLIRREVWKRDELVAETDRKADDVPARSIRIAQIRALGPLLAMAPSLSPRRVVTIDSIDDLERPAANALLKMLEEPPAGTIFLLVSHAPGRLLPTIRSRCRMLRFDTLDDAAMTAALREALPEASDAEIDALVPLGEGAPGRALGFAGLDVAALDGSIERLVREGDPTNAIRSALARSLALKAAQPRYELFLDRVPARIARAARDRSGDALRDAIGLWERARALAAVAVPQSFDAQSVVFELAGLLAALAPQPLAKGAPRR